MRIKQQDSAYIVHFMVTDSKLASSVVLHSRIANECYEHTITHSAKQSSIRMWCTEL